MARKGANTNERWYRRYPKVYARTVAWQTRAGRRVKETSTYVQFRGLNTVLDDFQASTTTSPYMANWRFANDRRTEQAYSLVSRTGAKFLKDIGTVFTDIKPEDEETRIELTVKQQIKSFHNSGTDTIVGGSVRLRNRSNAKGALLIHYIQDNKTLCSAFIDLAKVGYNFNNYSYRLIAPVKGVYETRFEIVDEFGEEYAELVERPVEVSATGKYRGEIAYTEVPVLGEAHKEVKPEWQPTSTTPLLGVMVNNNKFFGDLISVVVKDTPYLIFAVDNQTGSKRIGRFNKKTNEVDYIDGAYLHNNAQCFRGVLADGKIVFVDGVSRLRYIDVRDWTVHTANPELDKKHKAPDGFKYIALVNNRIYLANLPDSPNYVTYSMIDRNGARYFDFHDAFYSPNIATYDSRTTPITGISQHTDKSIIIYRGNGSSIFSAPDGFEFGVAQQQDTFINAIGIAEQEDTVSYNGSTYFFNLTEGFRRFSGADATITSAHIDNLIRQIPPNSQRYVYAHNKKIHIQIDDYQLVFDTTNSQSASAWLLDTQTFVYRTSTEQSTDRIWASHSKYAAFMELNTEHNKDFDCVIPCEYQTHYKHSPDRTGSIIVQRIMAHLSKSANTTWKIGFDKNHEDNPSVWTKVMFKSDTTYDSETDVFYNHSDSGANMINIPVHARCYVGQIRVKGYSYKQPIGISGLMMETQNVEAM